MVVISRSQPWKEKVHEGIVLDRNSKRIRIVVSEAPNDIRKGNWRLDRSANRVAHDRMKDALLRFHSSEGDQGTTLRDLLLTKSTTCRIRQNKVLKLQNPNHSIKPN